MADGGHLEFHDFVTFFHLAVSSILKLDIFRHTCQPLEFYFRGGAWGTPFSTTLHVCEGGLAILVILPYASGGGLCATQTRTDS